MQLRQGYSKIRFLLVAACLTVAAARHVVAAELPVADSAAKSLVVIDAGHGGKDPGTRSRTHVAEKDVTLALATKVAAELQRRGIEVILTRKSDAFVSLDERVNLSNSSTAALFISIHCDANSDTSMKGFSILRAKSSSPAAVAAAQLMTQHLQSSGITRRSVRRDDRGLRVLNGTQAPAILVETGFLSNKAEAANLASGTYQTKLAGAMADGIAEYLQSSSTKALALQSK